MRAHPFRSLLILFVSMAFGQPSKERVFHFKSDIGPQDIQEIATLVRCIGDLHELSADTAGQTLAIRGTAAELAFSEWLFNELNSTQHSSKNENEYRMSVAGDDVVHVFYVTNAQTVKEFNEIATAVRSTADIRRLYTHYAAKVVVARGSGAQIALAQWLFNMVDKPTVDAASARTESSANEYKYGAQGGEVVKVLYLNHIQTAMFFQEVTVVIRTIAHIRYGFTYTPARAFLVRGTAEQTALAEWLSNELDKPGHQDPSSSTREFKLSSNEAVRVFYLRPTDTVAAFQQFVSELRQTTHIRDAFTYNAPRALLVRGTGNEIAWAEQLIKAQNK
jgi:hypothetical protein